MKPEALILLKRESAQRLASVWSQELAETDGPLRSVTWARAADVALAAAKSAGSSLIEARICREDGTLDPLAKQYLHKKIADELRR